MLWELSVRTYTDEDYLPTQSLYAKAFHEMRVRVGDFPDSVVTEPSEKERKVWSEDAETRFVYGQNGELAAYAHLSGHEIGSVSVRTDVQGKGIGRAFVKYLCNEICRQGTIFGAWSGTMPAICTTALVSKKGTPCNSSARRSLLPMDNVKITFTRPELAATMAAGVAAMSGMLAVVQQANGAWRYILIAVYLCGLLGFAITAVALAFRRSILELREDDLCVRTKRWRPAELRAIVWQSQTRRVTLKSVKGSGFGLTLAKANAESDAAAILAWAETHGVPVERRP